MSMISAQCDELRSYADKADGTFPMLASALREAADTIWELRNKCVDLVDERERLFRANVEKNNKILRLVGENARLRKLVWDMRVCLEDECERCHDLSDSCDLESRIRDLGI